MMRASGTGRIGMSTRTSTRSSLCSGSLSIDLRRCVVYNYILFILDVDARDD
jgi:hypothetical protein